MTGCVAINCTNRREKGFRLFSIPTNVERRKKWFQNLRREQWISTKSACICEVHFEASQFESRRADGWRKLKPNAVPTLFDVPNPPPRIDSPPRKSLYKKPRNEVAATCAQKVAEVPITPEMMGKKYKKRPHSSDEEKENHWEKRFRRLLRRLEEQNSWLQKNIKLCNIRDQDDVSESGEPSPASQRNRPDSESEEVLSMREASPPPTASTVTPQNDQPQGSISEQGPTQAVDSNQSREADQVDENLLNVLGERRAVDKPLGAPILDEIVLRWTDLLNTGLQKEERSLLLNKYGTPENCLVINPPKINPEIKASLHEPVSSRDSRLVCKQEKVAVCLSVLGTTISELLKGKTADNLMLVERLNDMGKLLVDLQREETLTRKALILPNLNTSVKETLKATVVDEWLFGKQLEENLKTAKSLERSAKELSRASSRFPLNRTSKNWKGPLRQQTKRQSTTTGGQRSQETLQPATPRIPKARSNSRPIPSEEALLNPGTTPSVETPYPGSLNIMRQAFALRGMPEDSWDIAVSSLTGSSVRQYEITFKRWWSYCHLNHIDVFTVSIPDILSFLAKEFHKGASYASINSHRSAIAFILGPEIGQDDRVKKFCRDVSKKRPSKPKYSSTWDPKIVLDFLSSWTPNDKLCLENLTLKLVTLLALITGHRIQTLSLIDIHNIIKTRNLIEIKIPTRIKTSGPRREQPTLIIPFYPLNRSICVASTLESYVERTRGLRDRCSRLFISFRKPHRAVTTETLSRWVKSILTKSGINTETFSAYSTRHASISAAKRSGVNIDAIKRAAGWTKSSETFTKVYNLSIIEDKDVFARAILEL